MAASALPETLKSITATKIHEVTRQRDTFESTKASIYKKASSAGDQLSSTQALLNGVRQLRNLPPLNDAPSDEDDHQPVDPTAQQLYNKSLLLQQAKADPSVPPSVAADIGQSLKRELELESVRYQHAQFFSKLVTEWLTNPDHEDKTSESTSFEEIGRKEMHEQRATWEKLVFSPVHVDVTKLEAFLTNLFTGTKSAKFAYNNVVAHTKDFGSVMSERKELFNPDSLKGTLAALSNTDLLSEEKIATLRTFMTNKEVLKEVSDVLNMRYVTLSTWEWTASGKGIPVEMRRQLNGKYRVFMDEDVLDALLLYEIGLKWSVHFNVVFRKFFDSLAWKKSEKTIPKRDRERREYYMIDNAGARLDTVQTLRRTNYSTNYFLTQLPVDEAQGKRNYDEDNEDDEDYDKKSDTKSPLELKHGLLHMLVAESLISKTVRPDTVHTVIRSDFKWFGPGLPHETVYTILKFFGVSDAWLEFFRRFLEAPLYFVHDGPGAQVHTRKRGIPLSHTMSDVLGEVVLFVMDYTVNQATSSYLYRLHDDFWLWGSEELCLRGWQSMTKFAKIVGIEFNEEKTGTVRFGVASTSRPSDSDSDSEMSDDDDFAYSANTTVLPTGEVRWGFLRLDAASGRFLVDQSQVDAHIKELRLQLSYCKSIFSYIQAYNAYVGRFFTNNFGKPSYAFGREHVDMMIDTFARIQRELFPSGSVTDHLAGLAEERFGIKGLPQGFWYFPIQQGGLELRNPLIPLFGMRESLRRSPQRMLERCYEKEVQDYMMYEHNFKNSNRNPSFGQYNTGLVQEILNSGEIFMPQDEYFGYREEQSRRLANVYQKFLEVPPEKEMQETADLESVLTHGNPRLENKQGKPGIFSSFSSMQPYWKWTVALYGKDIVERYGSVRMVDEGQVPIGIVSLMRKGRVRWRG